MTKSDNDNRFRKAVNVDDIITKQEGLEIIKPEIRRKKNTGLTPISQLPKGVRKQMATKAFEASELKRQEAKTFAEAFEMLADIVLNLESDQDAIKVLETHGIKPNERQIIAFREMQRAKIDTKSFIAVRDSVGEKPTEKQQITVSDRDIGEIYQRWAGQMEQDKKE